MENCTVYLEAFDRVIGFVNQRNDLVKNQLEKLAPQFAQNIAKVRSDVSDLQTGIGRDTQLAQTNFERYVLGLTILGVLVASSAPGGSSAASPGPFSASPKACATMPSRRRRPLPGHHREPHAGRRRFRQAAALEESSASLEEMAGMTAATPRTPRTPRGSPIRRVPPPTAAPPTCARCRMPCRRSRPPAPRFQRSSRPSTKSPFRRTSSR